MKKTLLTIALALSVFASLAHAEEAKAKPPERPKVDLVFVLDTTGSMEGLIATAKEKIWAIANTLASAKPTPEIRIGLVAYRDRGDEYVTRIVELSDDLDAVYAKLVEFKATGGDDSLESVNQALNEGVTKMAWSPDSKTYKVLFLVGDWGPHMDYKDDIKYDESCKIAAGKGIVINAIQCGKIPETTPVWQEIARRADGQFFRVEQSGSAIVAATPFDADIAKLSRELDGTRVYYGDAKSRDEATGREKSSRELYEKAAVSAMAQRASFNSSEAGLANFIGTGNELVSEIADGKVKLVDIKDDQLPEEWRKLSPEERQKRLDELVAKRRQLQKDIRALAEKRQAYVEDEVKRNAKSASSFDVQVFNTMRDQAAQRKISIEGGPKY